ncbi:MAG: outer membrane protein assembly factor BamE [Gammaproteobacteria bacterium]|jgi:outer membrane protein assembly factor BamE|tara:strand:- start:1275 stop:1955 length:681 start_codon:yes stop_codon:yes gene_type:complete
MRKITLISALSLLLLSCSKSYVPGIPQLSDINDLKFVHKIDIQQGNVVTQNMLAQLEVGMDKEKVQFIMGTPIIMDTFNSHRWDYIFTYDRKREFLSKRTITLYFEGDSLSVIKGNIKAAEKELVAKRHEDAEILVPRFVKRSMKERILNKLSLSKDKKGKFADADENNEVTEADKKVEYHTDKIIKAVEKSPYVGLQSGPGEGPAIDPNAIPNDEKKSLVSRLFD